MHGLDGLKIFRKFKKINPQVKIIIMTGYAKDDIIDRVKNEGAYSIIYKPFQMLELIDLVDSINSPDA